MTENKYIVVGISMTSSLCGKEISEQKYIVGRVSGRNFCYVSDGIERKCHLREDMKILGSISSEDKENVAQLIDEYYVNVRNIKLEYLQSSQNIDAATDLLRQARTISPLCHSIVYPSDKVLDNVTNTVERVQMGANVLIELFGRELAEHKRKLNEIEIDFSQKLNRYFV